MPSHDFDLIVLGGGSAGFAAARRGRAHGATVAMVERGVLGGECPNTACVPTKALLRSAEAVEEARRAGEFGVRVGPPAADWPAIRDRTARIVAASGSDSETEGRLLKEGIRVFRGHARFHSPREVQVDGITLRAPRIVLTAGSSDHVPPIPGLAESGFITHVEAIGLRELPESLVIIGAGPVGVEFSQIFAPFCVRVTLLSASPLPLPREDHDVSRCLLGALQERGIQIETGVRVERVARRGGEKVVTVRREEAVWECAAAEVFLGAGHWPAVDDLGLEQAGVEASRRGVKVDETLRTTAPGIWAAGDVTGIALFTHVAHYQGQLAGNNAFTDAPRTADHRVVPRATFCRPEVASVGLTEQELMAAGADYRAACYPISKLEKSLVTGEREGLAKLLADAAGQILGAHVIGARAGELIHEIAVAMQSRVPVSGIAGTIHAFPNFAEIWGAVSRKL
jgi:pyruvate/2-oxoglutarate dehydrogenase complex dihydrolipoamide dehydrogenase (E3) component